MILSLLKDCRRLLRINGTEAGIDKISRCLIAFDTDARAAHQGDQCAFGGAIGIVINRLNGFYTDQFFLAQYKHPVFRPELTDIAAILVSYNQVVIMEHIFDVDPVQ